MSRPVVLALGSLAAALALAGLSPAALAQPAAKASTKRSPTYGERLLSIASELKGVRYDFGGRLRDDEGIDCQGIIFYATERLGRCDWRSWSVMPTRTLAREELGKPAVARPVGCTGALASCWSARAGEATPGRPR